MPKVFEVYAKGLIIYAIGFGLSVFGGAKIIGKGLHALAMKQGDANWYWQYLKKN